MIAPRLSEISRLSKLLLVSSLTLCGCLTIGCAPDDPQSSGEPRTVVEPPEPQAPVTPESADTSESAGDPTPAETTAATVTLKPASLDEVAALIQAQGKPTVVDYWSLACQPCMDEFPGLVKLHETYGDRLACISVDVDYDGRKTKPAESYEPAVKAFLESQNATLANYLCTTPSDEVYGKLKIDSIPSVFVFDAEGQLVKKFVDAGETAGFGYEKDVAPLVAKLLAGEITAASAE